MGKKWISILLCAAMTVGVIAGCSYDTQDASKKADASDENGMEAENDVITIGFSQVGAESDWRTAHSESIKKVFSEKNGYELIFDDARQKQENQVAAIFSFIQQEVDYIVLAPVTETGWDTVLQEAKDAGIPVIVVDRMVKVSDESLYTAWVGSDFKLEGRKACAWLDAYAKAKGMQEINIVDIQGTYGATPQIGRTQALTEAVEQYGWNLLAMESGEFTQAKGKEVMASMLEQYENINVVYCENDNQAFGAIEAIEDAGKTVGPDGDILVISFDATHGGIVNTMKGKIVLNVECNPLHGPRVEDIIKKLEEGKEVDKQIFTEERMYSHGADVPVITVDGTDYEITEVTQDIEAGRAT